MDSGFVGLLTGIGAMLLTVTAFVLSWIKERNRSIAETQENADKSSTERETRAGDVWKALVVGLEKQIAKLQEEIVGLKEEVKSLKDMLIKAADETAKHQELLIKDLQTRLTENEKQILKQAQRAQPLPSTEDFPAPAAVPTKPGSVAMTGELKGVVDLPPER